MRVLSVVGNRPQFIKAAAVSAALRGAGIDEVVLHTGQHYDAELSQVFFEELGLAEPEHRLNLHTAEPGVMQPEIAHTLDGERPDWTLVYGDTNSTLAGARAAVEAGVPIAHVEAGLRSGDWTMPEERTRVEVDRISRLLLAPGEGAAETLRGEGAQGQIEVVGDVMYDVCLQLGGRVLGRRDALVRFGLQPGGYILATVHREANVSPGRLKRITEALGRIPEPVVFPAHPRTRGALSTLGIELPSHVQVTDPLGYLDFGELASHARVIVTDSGGLQKEAYWHGVPCVTLRPSTEWAETIEQAANTLVDDDPDLLVDAVRRASFPANAPRLYGDGRAAERVADALQMRDR